jgi:hypothetical protein
VTRCVYCGKDKQESDLSQEHVIPRGIGGNLKPVNPFSIDNVCGRCNSVCGTYVDGPFIKNWFTKNYRTEELYRCADIAKNPILPLRYMGPYKELQFEDRLCEFWLGPTGDRIYHFHRPYPEEPDIAPMVGVPTFARKAEIDQGFAFLFVRSNNPLWYPTVFLSFVENFKGSTLYLGNGVTPQGGGFVEIPDYMKPLHAQLISLNGKTHHIGLALDLSFGDRFMAKLALGIGSLLLDDGFADSTSADLLRRFLWTKNPKERRDIPIMGTGFFNESHDKLDKILSWGGGHVIALLPIEDALGLYVSFYETYCSMIKVSSEPEHWVKKGLGDGIVYVIAPGLQKHVGPKELLAYIAHKNSSTKDNELIELETEMNMQKELPSFDI